MPPDAPWIDRALYYGLHPYNSWLFLPLASLACLIGLLALRQRNVVQVNAYRSFLISFGVSPLLIYSVKDVSSMLAHAANGAVRVLKYAYLVLGLPTLLLFVLAIVLLAVDGRSAASAFALYRWRAGAIFLVIALTVLQTLWLFEAAASL